MSSMPYSVLSSAFKDVVIKHLLKYHRVILMCFIITGEFQISHLSVLIKKIAAIQLSDNVSSSGNLEMSGRRTVWKITFFFSFSSQPTHPSVFHTVQPHLMSFNFLFPFPSHSFISLPQSQLALLIQRYSHLLWPIMSRPSLQPPSFILQVVSPYGIDSVSLFQILTG